MNTKKIIVLAYLPDGTHTEITFERWPRLEDLPGEAVRFDIAVPHSNTEHLKSSASQKMHEEWA